MFDLLSNGVVQVVLLGTMLLGLVSGVLGVFLLLRRQALIGDALSHSTLPGVVIAFMITTSKDLNVLLIGATVSAIIAMFLMRLIKKYSKLENDAILALILSSFFGLGRFLISLVSRNPEYSKARLDDFIFGSAATMIERDVLVLIVVSVIVLLLIILFWRHLKLHTFDRLFYQTLGFSDKFVEFLISTMTILVIVSGIRSVGVILMSALLIVPGVAARQFSHDLRINVVLAGVIGTLTAFSGTLISVAYPGSIPTGPVIVVVGTVIAIAAMFLAPKRGIISKHLEQKRHKEDIKKYKTLLHLYSTDTLDEAVPDYLIEEELVEIKDQQVLLTLKGEQKVQAIIGGEN